MGNERIDLMTCIRCVDLTTTWSFSNDLKTTWSFLRDLITDLSFLRDLTTDLSFLRDLKTDLSFLSIDHPHRRLFGGYFRPAIFIFAYVCGTTVEQCPFFFLFGSGSSAHHVRRVEIPM